MYIDKAKISVESGRGGNGAISFRHDPFVPKGGPDGGDGGSGGDIIFVSDSNLETLRDFKYKRIYKAESGANGAKKNMTGGKGADLKIKVPVGTMIFEEESGLLIGDLTESGQELVAAMGGKGGKGNAAFKNSVRKSPRFAEAGSASRKLSVILNLKLIADVGLVGLPSAGKTSFLNAVTNAHAKVGEYHFTTIAPNLGVASKYNFVIADIPGLIEGASEGHGLGLEFLKHVERTKLLFHIVDISEFEGKPAIENFHMVMNELKKYGNGVFEKPMVVIGNKSDIAEGSDFGERMKKENRTYFEVSAAERTGLDDALAEARRLLDEIAGMEAAIATEAAEIKNTKDVEEPKKFDVHRIEEDEDYREIKIEKRGKTASLSGKQLGKIFASTNLNDEDSLRYLYKYLEERGAVERLLDLGVASGEEIEICGQVMRFEA